MLQGGGKNKEIKEFKEFKDFNETGHSYSDLLRPEAKKVASPMQYFAFRCIYRVEPR